jgi:hypothetical protein
MVHLDSDHDRAVAARVPASVRFNCQYALDEMDEGDLQSANNPEQRI